MVFKKYSSFILVIIFLMMIVFFLTNHKDSFTKTEGNDIKYVKIAGQMIKVDLALTQIEQEQGLSGRKNLQSDEGMLFIFSKPAKNYFWMKDMNFPIDIIWIDQNFRVIYIEKSATPSSYANSFGPGVDNRYVLEVSAGFSEKNNLKVGDLAEFLR